MENFKPGPLNFFKGLIYGAAFSLAVWFIIIVVIGLVTNFVH